MILKWRLWILIFILCLTGLSCRQKSVLDQFKGDEEKLMVIFDFFTLYAAFDSYKEINGGYPKSLGALAEDDPPWISGDLANGRRGYYIYEYTQLAKNKFEIIAHDPGVAGETVFYMCQDGFIKLDNAKGRVVYRSPIAEKKERKQLIWLLGIPAIFLIGLFYFTRH